MKRLLALTLILGIVATSIWISAYALRVPKADEWGDVWNSAEGSWTATDNADGTTTVAITNSGTDKRITTSKSYKLDGLYISLIDVSTNATAVPLMITPNAGGWVDGQGLLSISGGSMIYYKEVVDNQSSVIQNINTGWSNFIANNPRNSLFMYFYKQDDGSFKFQINGGIFDITADEVIRMFGSADPNVYFSIGGSWYQDGPNTSIKVKEISSDPNRLRSYYDQFGRDSFVSVTDYMSGMTINHIGNEGAYNVLAKPVKLAGLDFKYVDVSPAQAPGTLWFKYSTAPDGVYNITNAPGVLYMIDEVGRVLRYSNGWVEVNTSAGKTFHDGTNWGRPSEISVTVRKDTATGNFIFTFTGNYTAAGATNVIVDTLSSADINTTFGSADPKTYLNFTASATQTVGIESIRYDGYTVVVEEPEVSVTGVSLNQSSISLKAGETATLTAMVSPDNATNKAVVWSSSDSSIAKVENGIVTGLKKGTSTITVKTLDGNITANCVVTVTSDAVSSGTEEDSDPRTKNPGTGASRDILMLIAVCIISAGILFCKMIKNNSLVK